MKSNYAGQSQLSRTTTMSSVPAVDRGLGNQKEPAKTTATLSAAVAAIFALYAVMFLSVYLWSRYAPVFPPDSVEGPAIVEAMPWSR